MEAKDKRFQQYQRIQIAEMRHVTENDIDYYKRFGVIPFDMTERVSISDADKNNGSPKVGDMIARNPKNHSDQWLVSEQYFKDNFSALDKQIAEGKEIPDLNFFRTNILLHLSKEEMMILRDWLDSYETAKEIPAGAEEMIEQPEQIQSVLCSKCLKVLKPIYICTDCIDRTFNAAHSL